MAWRFAKASNARIVNVTTDEDLALKTSQVVKDFLNDELYQLLFAVRIRKNTLEIKFVCLAKVLTKFKTFSET
jgi:hypothetical protein